MGGIFRRPHHVLLLIQPLPVRGHWLVIDFCAEYAAGVNRVEAVAFAQPVPGCPFRLVEHHSRPVSSRKLGCDTATSRICPR